MTDQKETKGQELKALADKNVMAKAGIDVDKYTQKIIKECTKLASLCRYEYVIFLRYDIPTDYCEGIGMMVCKRLIQQGFTADYDEEGNSLTIGWR